MSIILCKKQALCLSLFLITLFLFTNRLFAEEKIYEGLCTEERIEYNSRLKGRNSADETIKYLNELLVSTDNPAIKNDIAVIFSMNKVENSFSLVSSVLHDYPSRNLIFWSKKYGEKIIPELLNIATTKGFPTSSFAYDAIKGIGTSSFTYLLKAYQEKQYKDDADKREMFTALVGYEDSRLVNLFSTELNNSEDSVIRMKALEGLVYLNMLSPGYPIHHFYCGTFSVIGKVEPQYKMRKEDRVTIFKSIEDCIPKATYNEKLMLCENLNGFKDLGGIKWLEKWAKEDPNATIRDKAKSMLTDGN